MRTTIELRRDFVDSQLRDYTPEGFLTELSSHHLEQRSDQGLSIQVTVTDIEAIDSWDSGIGLTLEGDGYVLPGAVFVSAQAPRMECILRFGDRTHASQFSENVSNATQGHIEEAVVVSDVTHLSRWETARGSGHAVSVDRSGWTVPDSQLEEITRQERPTN